MHRGPPRLALGVALGLRRWALGLVLFSLGMRLLERWLVPWHGRG